MRFLAVLLCCIVSTVSAQQTFTNPLLPGGADPWSMYKDGYYYYTHTTGRNITIWKTKDITDLRNAEKKLVYTPPPGTEYSKDVWAPEIHFLQGKWYVYFAADGGSNHQHRMFVIENASADPLQGEWTFKGKITTPGDKWSIDGSVFEHRRQLYFTWSGWAGNDNGQQNIYIAKMKNPWTIEGERVTLSRPEKDWETVGDLGNDPVRHVNVNEGPQFLSRGKKVFLVYSASGCWTDFYVLGMLSARAGSNLLDTASWRKSPEPVFKGSPANRVFAPGHNSFFKSPNGREDWILYHANSDPSQGCGGKRSPRAQKFTWKADGTPDFGVPVKAGEPMRVPAR